ncbi:hypothetical protein BDF22DRAFT_741996 [Syncephalis plumigaleata]|nr:hypothetical protein BDF22DRAFT_741996 [Syncephalis plumigaleata]
MDDNTVPSSYNGFEFFWDARYNMDELRHRYAALRFQLLSGTLLSIVLVRNVWHSAVVVANFPRKFAPWSCLFISTLGTLVLGGITIPAIGLNGLSCNAMGWSLINGVVLSSVACNFILLERAYVACQQKRWFLIFGVIFSSVPAFIFLIVTIASSAVIYSSNYGCHLQYPDYLPYVRIITDLPQNVMFSAIFCLAIYRNYRQRKEYMWKELARDGIITMLLVALSNIVSFIIGETSILGEYTNTIYIADWVLTSTLLSESIYKIHIKPHLYASSKKSTTHPAATDMPRGVASTTYRTFRITEIDTYQEIQ